MYVVGPLLGSLLDAQPCLPALPQVQEQLKPLMSSVNKQALDQYTNFTEQRDDVVRRKQVGRLGG